MTSSNNTGVGVSGGGVGSAAKGDSLKRGIRYSHFARIESSQVLEAAMQDLINIFQIKVYTLCTCTCKWLVWVLEVPVAGDFPWGFP